MITLTILAILTILTFIKFFSIQQTTEIVIFTIVSFLVMTFMVSSPGRKFTGKLILRKYSIKFAGFWRVLKWYLLNKNLIALNGALTLLKLVLMAASTYVIFLAMGTNVLIYDIMIITSTVFVVKLMPPPFNFFGIREAVTISLAVLLYGKLGIASPIVMGTYAILFALNYFYALLTLLFVNQSLIIPHKAVKPNTPQK